MPDPNIPLAVKPLDTATGVQQANQQANQNQSQDNANQAQQNSNALATEQTLKAHYEALDTREKSRLGSTIVGAVQLKQFLDRGDLQGAQSFLEQRKTQLQQRMASGENVDTQETDYALQALRTGNMQELKNGVDGLIAAGQVYGILKNENNPYIDQFNAVKKAHPQWSDAQVQDYVYTRGNVGKGTVFDGQGQVVNQPGAVAAAAQKEGATQFAGGEGGAAGKAVVANNTTIGNLSNISQAVASAKEQLPKVASTGPVFGRTGEAARDVNYVNLQRDLNEITLLAKDLYNLGSGQGFTDADRDFLKELSGGSYNRADSIQYALDRFEKTIANREQVLQQQNQGYRTQFSGQGAQPGAAAPGQAAPAGVTPSGGKLKVSNGQQTFMINPNDLAAAQKDGFQQQQ